MEEDTEYLKLPLEERCVHKLWKARLNAYEECVKFFKTSDEKSPELNKYAPLMKKFVTDSNAVAQEKALDAVVAYVANASAAGKVASDVVAGLVVKCLAAPKKPTQDKALEIILMYCEIEKYEAIQEELTKGLSQKNPKVVAACIRAMSTALREFGPKVISIKPLVKLIGPILEDRDRNVREEGKRMIIEMYRWINQALRPQLSSLKPIQIQELEAEFDKIGNVKATQSRFLRSEQAQREGTGGATDEADGVEGDIDEPDEIAEIDPLRFIDPTNILNQLPKDFYEKVEAKKWQERKEAMEVLLPLAQNPKVEAGDYGDLVKALRKIITKDTNVMIIALAGQCLAGLAKGLKEKFSPYAVPCIETVLVKFKEKKPNVVTALKEAADAIFLSTSIESIQECTCIALNNKNPQVKAETAAFLARSFCYCTPTLLNKKLLKAFVTELLKTLNESDPSVRDASAEALGAAFKVVGEKTMMSFISDVDSLKMQKTVLLVYMNIHTVVNLSVLAEILVLEYKPQYSQSHIEAIKDACEKAEIKVKLAPVKSKPKSSQKDQESQSHIRKGTFTKLGRGNKVSKNVKDSESETTEVKSNKGDKSSASRSRTTTAQGRGTVAVDRAGSNTDRPQTSPGSKGRGVSERAGRAHSASRVGADSSRKEETKAGPLLQVNNLKKQRAIDEQRVRILRWDFTTPRSEFITQLKDQMTTAGFNSQLILNMFHNDFRFHLKALDALAENLVSNSEACLCNLDLILRWLTIRFFDTNPSVLMKAMDFLQNVFHISSQQSYHMMDHEAYAFLPFLVTKLGDSKDSIRSPARNIAKNVCKIYPASKVSPYIIEGLHSKNARQRAECLESLCSLIEIYGMSVCQPSPSAAVKEIAKQISDRDSAVRNSALNCLVQVYFKEGEKMYKLIGNERIKRSSKCRPQIKKPLDNESSSVPGGGVGQRVNRVIPTVASMAAPSIKDNRSSERSKINSESEVQNLFQLDRGLIEKLLEDVSTEEKPKMQVTDIPDIDEILADKPAFPKPLLSSRTTRQYLEKSDIDDVKIEEAAQAINLVISQVATPDTDTVIKALSQLDEAVQNENTKLQLIPHIDQLLTAATLQYRLVLNTKMTNTNVCTGDCVKIYRSLTSFLLSIFNSKDLGIKASRDVLHDVIHVLISILLDPRLTQLDDGPQVTRAINILVIRIIEKAQFTNIFSACLRLLHESVGSGGSGEKFTELVMKCNWKVIKILPSRTSDINVEQILLDIHNFLLVYPISTWTERSSDFPLRTIKTIIHSLCSHYESTVLTQFAKLENAQGSELHKYLSKVLKKSATDKEGNIADSNKLASAQGTAESGAGKSKKLSKAVHNTLSEIFQKIGSKENTKEGLVQLYEFKQRNPDADLDPYLRKSSQFFQNYIERGLQKVEIERQSECKQKSNSHFDSNVKSGVPLSSFPVEQNRISELLDQFKAIAARAGFDNAYIDTAVKDICSTDPKSSDDTCDYAGYIKTLSPGKKE